MPEKELLKDSESVVTQTQGFRTTEPISFLAVLRARCPRCRIGKVTDGIFSIYPRCAHCDYDFNPESGFYLGAMMLGFLVTSILTIPPVIYLKVSGADDAWVLGYPFVQYLILGPLLTYYAKILWLHLSYRSGAKMDSR
ncbi:MAG: DUF983 domain-containing protein [Cryobacterium sp.]|nr:DUF983 domain-containing protein [Oligoflexia bacterium]